MKGRNRDSPDRNPISENFSRSHLGDLDLREVISDIREIVRDRVFGWLNWSPGAA